MSYFLKKTNNKKGTYLQIYESYYDPDSKMRCSSFLQTFGVCTRTSGYQGIEDPIACLLPKRSRNLIRNCKQKKQAEKEQQISDDVSRKTIWGIFP